MCLEFAIFVACNGSVSAPVDNMSREDAILFAYRQMFPAEAPDRCGPQKYLICQLTESPKTQSKVSIVFLIRVRIPGDLHISR